MRSKSEQGFLEAVASITSAQALNDLLSQYPLHPPTWLWTQIIFCRSDPARIFAKTRGEFKVSSASQHIGAFYLDRAYGRKERRETQGAFVILNSSVEHVYRLVSVAGREFWVLGLLPLIRATFPQLMPLFFRQREIQEALSQLERVIGTEGRLILTRASVKERLTPPTKSRVRVARRYRSDIFWTEEDIHTAFAKAEDRGQWFKTLSMYIHREVSAEVTSFTISKDGWYTWDHFEPSLDEVLQAFLIPVAAARLSLLVDRGLRVRAYKAAAPIAIDFQSDIFADQRGLQALERTLAKYPHSSKAVLHRNPYLHMSLSDQTDGSSFDVWVLSLHRLLLLPGLEASEGALGRVVNHIFENFSEGEVGVYGAPTEDL